MVSTHKCYRTDNFPVLRHCANRGESLYHVRLYADRGGFLTPRFGVMRMKVLLGFIESKTTVIDAVIKTDENLDYLSVICSSPAKPLLFSRVITSYSIHYTKLYEVRFLINLEGFRVNRSRIESLFPAGEERFEWR